MPRTSKDSHHRENEGLHEREDGSAVEIEDEDDRARASLFDDPDEDHDEERDDIEAELQDLEDMEGPDA